MVCFVHAVILLFRFGSGLTATLHPRPSRSPDALQFLSTEISFRVRRLRGNLGCLPLVFSLVAMCFAWDALGVATSPARSETPGRLLTQQGVISKQQQWHLPLPSCSHLRITLLAIRQTFMFPIHSAHATYLSINSQQLQLTATEVARHYAYIHSHDQLRHSARRRSAGDGYGKARRARSLCECSVKPVVCASEPHSGG